MAKKNKERKQRRRRHPNSHGIRLVCSDCQAETRVKRRELLRAARLRCEACGGPLNKPQHIERPAKAPTVDWGLSPLISHLDAWAEAQRTLEQEIMRSMAIPAHIFEARRRDTDR